VGQQPPEYEPYQQPYGQPPPPYEQPPIPYGQAPAPYGQAPAPYGFSPAAPYGVDPVTGAPFSDKSKLVAGLLQILIPFGFGRMYMGHTGVGVAQLLVTLFTCGLGSLWPFIDGILILVGNPRDGNGRPMKMG
jgi:TM2 domain-containing membrane protein YozV